MAKEQGDELLSRRQALLRAGAAAGAVIAGFATTKLNSPTTYDKPGKPVRHLPRGTLVLLGGHVEPGRKLFALAEGLGIPAEKLQVPHDIPNRLSEDEIRALAEKCDFAGVFADMQKYCPVNPIKGKTVVCVTSASENATTNAHLDRILFRLLGAKDVVCIDSRAQAELPAIAAKMRDPDTGMVYFDGGAQDVLASNFAGTRACEAMRQRYLNDPRFTVAGSSAGAAVAPGQGDMIAGWNREKTKAAMASGLGLLDSVIVDTHLHRSSLPRLPRLQAAVAERKDCIGLGLDERTGVVIRDGSATVIGQQKVWKIMPEDTRLPLAELQRAGHKRGDRIPLGEHAYVMAPQALLAEGRRR